MSKKRKEVVQPIQDAAAQIKDGMTIAVGGFGADNHPMAVVRQIIRQVYIPTRHAHEECPHGRLMPPHQLGEGLPIFARQDADDEVCVGEGQEVGYLDCPSFELKRSTTQRIR